MNSVDTDRLRALNKNIYRFHQDSCDSMTRLMNDTDRVLRDIASEYDESYVRSSVRDAERAISDIRRRIQEIGGKSHRLNRNLTQVANEYDRLEEEQANSMNLTYDGKMSFIDNIISNSGITIGSIFAAGSNLLTKMYENLKKSDMTYEEFKGHMLQYQIDYFSKDSNFLELLDKEELSDEEHYILAATFLNLDAEEMEKFLNACLVEGETITEDVAKAFNTAPMNTSYYEACTEWYPDKERLEDILLEMNKITDVQHDIALQCYINMQHIGKADELFDEAQSLYETVAEARHLTIQKAGVIAALMNINYVASTDGQVAQLVTLTGNKNDYNGLIGSYTLEFKGETYDGFTVSQNCKEQSLNIYVDKESSNFGEKNVEDMISTFSRRFGDNILEDSITGGIKDYITSELVAKTAEQLLLSISEQGTKVLPVVNVAYGIGTKAIEQHQNVSMAKDMVKRKQFEEYIEFFMLDLIVIESSEECFDDIYLLEPSVRTNKILQNYNEKSGQESITMLDILSDYERVDEMRLELEADLRYEIIQYE